MARIIEERTTTPAYVEDSSGPAIGMILGLVLGVLAVIVLGALFLNGTFRNSSPAPAPAGSTGGGASAPAQPSAAPSAS